MDYGLLGTALKDFEQNWCQNTKCSECPIANKEEGGACPPVNIGRIVSHHKFLVKCLGMNDEDAYKHVFDFESEVEPTEIEKCKFVTMITMMDNVMHDGD